MNDYTPRKGSAAEAAVEYLRKKGGPARSGEIAEAIGIETKNLTASLAAAVDNGVLMACDVTVPGSAPQKEYRLSGGGKPIAWRQPKPTTLSPSPSPASGRGERPAPAQEAAKPARKPRKRPKPATPHPRGASRPKVTGRLLRAAAEGQRKTAKPPQIIPEKIPAAADASALKQFRCGIFNSGHLELILRDGTRVELQPEDTRVLCGYLDQMLVKEAA